MAQVVKHVPKLGPESQQEALDRVARAHHPALHSTCPDVGTALTSPVRGGDGGPAPLGRRWVGSSRGQKCLLSAMLGQVPAGTSFG